MAKTLRTLLKAARVLGASGEPHDRRFLRRGDLPPANAGARAPGFPRRCFEVILRNTLEWRNWQTHGTQNPA
ncbi:MAG TPA: hypothetical protein VFA54_02920, partial [Bryobacterales bacterium]|nr:hypothetical protein [Bryobacterales bacterium]